MKIDLNSQLASQLLSERSTEQVKHGVTATAPGITEDRTTLSADSTSIRSLARQALKSPEIRQAMVDAVRQSIGNRNYQVDATKIAAAIVSNGGR